MKTKTSIQTCIDMHTEGRTPQEIAQVLGVRATTVTRYLRTARDQGRLPPMRPQQQRLRVKGTMRDVTGALTPEVMMWLYAQTPEGSMVAEAVAAIITDAYFEENPA